MSYSQDISLEQELEAALYAKVAEEGTFVCRYHPDKPAAAACCRCGVPLCEDCFSESYPRLICRRCRSGQVKMQLLKGGLKALKMPFLWVLICVIASGIAYWFGMGNTSIEELARHDAKYDWYRQRAPMLLVQKANRQYRRAMGLAELGRGDQALKWHEWTVESLEEAFKYWENTPVGGAIRIAEAKAVGGMGDFKRAADMLESLHVNEKSPVYLARFYYLGVFYEKLGDRAKSDQYYNEACQNADAARGKALDRYLDQVLDNAVEGKKIFLICHTLDAVIQPEDVFTKLKDRDLPYFRAKKAEEERLYGKWEVKKEVESKPKEEKEPSFEVERVN